MPALNNKPVTASAFATHIRKLGPFERNPVIAVAVSGGADSMALCLLAHRWAQAENGTIVALTIDHGLRPESASEALQVKAWLNKLGIKHHILTWTPPVMESGIPASAREARYRLMADYCREHAILHLLSAHHRDDQAETLFFRIARGSGMEGLACMAALTHVNGVRLLRPLLNVSKSQLVALLQSTAQPWIDDPTNENMVYTRNFIRWCLEQSIYKTTLTTRAASLTQFFGKWRKLLDHLLAVRLTKCLELYPEAYAILKKEVWRNMDKDTRVAILARVVITLSGVAYPPRNEQLRLLHDDMLDPAPKRSFGGLLFIDKGNRWLVCREPNAVEELQTIAVNTKQRWDRRFEVEWRNHDPHSKELTVRALGQWDEKHFGKPPLPKAVLRTLPSFWHLEKLVAVPHIGYMHPDYAQCQFNAWFFPAKPLAGAAFFSMNSQYE